MSTEEKPHLIDHVRIENGTIAPPSTPEQEKIVEVPEEIINVVEVPEEIIKVVEVPEEIIKVVEVPEEIQKIVEELRKLEQVPEQTENPVDLNEINKEDLIKFDNFDFNLLLL